MVPWTTTTLIGRRTQVQEICARLDRHRLVTLTGMAGAGKTRLAMAVIDEVRAAGRPVVRVDVAAVGPELRIQDEIESEVAAAIATAVCSADDWHRPTRERLERAADEAEMLLVLDGCDQALEICRSVVTMLLRGGPGVSLLVASRELLGLPGELTWTVTGLPVEGGDDDAIRLFLDRAATIRPGWTPGPHERERIARICARLNGLPLAIELAAARCRVLTVEQIDAGLDDCLRLLVGPDGSPSLEASIDLSHRRLPEPEAAVFRRLSVFPGGAGLDAIAEVCAEPDVLDRLNRLTERSLLQVRLDGPSMRFGLPEAVRQYAAVRLDRAAETAVVRQRQIAWAVRILEGDDLIEPDRPGACGPGAAVESPAWLDRVERELDNLRQALIWATDADPAAGLRLAGRMWRFCRSRGRYAQGRTWTTQALAAWTAAGQVLPDDAPGPVPGPAAEPHLDLARVLHGCGRLAFLQCDYDEAARRLRQARACYPDQLTEADEPWLGLAGIARERGEYAEAADILQRLRDRARRRGEDAPLAGYDLSLGMVAWLRGDLEEARVQAATALGTYRRLRDVAGASEAELLLGAVELACARPDRARPLLEAALAKAREQENREGEAYALHGLGVLARPDGASVAWALLARALQIHHELGDRWRSADVLDDLARCAVQVGAGELAGRLVGAADAARASIGAPVPAVDRDARDRLLGAITNLCGASGLTAERIAGSCQDLDRVVHECGQRDGLLPAGPPEPATAQFRPPRPAAQDPGQPLMVAPAPGPRRSAERAAPGIDRGGDQATAQETEQAAGQGTEQAGQGQAAEQGTEQAAGRGQAAGQGAEQAAGRGTGRGAELGTGQGVAPGTGQAAAQAQIRERLGALEIRTLGEARVCLGGRELSSGDWGYAKPRELLHFLLYNGGADKAGIGLALWPDADPGALRGAFHTTLNRLRRVVGAERIRYLRGRYVIGQTASVRYDVEQFRRSVEAVAQTDDDVQRESLWRGALEQYRGDFVAGEEFRDWVTPVREELRRSAERVALDLGRHLLTGADPRAAIPVFHRALDLDPLLEAAHRGLMHCQVRLGEPARALRQFAQLEKTLRSEIDAAPSSSTVALARRIRTSLAG